MAHSERAIYDGLEACLYDVLHGQISPDGVTKRLDDLLSGVPGSSSDLYPHLVGFSNNVVEQLLSERMPFRATMLAELAARVARCSRMQWGVSVVLVCAYRLLGLRQFEAALSILGLDEQSTSYATPLQAKLMDVLRLRCGFQRNRSVFRGEADQHSSDSDQGIGAKRRWRS